MSKKNWRADAGAGFAIVEAVSTLNVVPGDLIAFADDHRAGAVQINTALAAASPAVTTMPAGYGRVGAAFIGAINEFQVTLTVTGTALVGQYQQMSEALHNAARVYAATDDATGAAIASSVGHDTTDGLNDTA